MQHCMVSMTDECICVLQRQLMVMLSRDHFMRQSLGQPSGHFCLALTLPKPSRPILLGRMASSILRYTATAGYIWHYQAWIQTFGYSAQPQIHYNLSTRSIFWPCLETLDLAKRCNSMALHPYQMRSGRHAKSQISCQQTFLSSLQCLEPAHWSI